MNFDQRLLSLSETTTLEILFYNKNLICVHCHLKICYSRFTYDFPYKKQCIFSIYQSHIQLLPCPRHYFKYFVSIYSFTLLNIPMRQLPLLSLYYRQRLCRQLGDKEFTCQCKNLKVIREVFSFWSLKQPCTDLKLSTHTICFSKIYVVFVCYMKWCILILSFAGLGW